MMDKMIQGFSKFSKQEKINWLEKHFLPGQKNNQDIFNSFSHPDSVLQKQMDGFSENTIANFPLPFGIAPNFLIDDQVYAVPMVIEESSVVAAASAAAKYWSDRGGFRTTLLGTVKVGHIHFTWAGSFQHFREFVPELESAFNQGAQDIITNMQKRGGGIRKIEFLDFSQCAPGLFQCRVHFDTCNSMGANFINTVLERYANILEQFFVNHPSLTDKERDIEIIMSILSNYTPECLVRAEVKAPIESLGKFANGMMGHALAEKFCLAVKIARQDVYRAATHNKGIFNGIDAVVLATGNDFRAIEAGGHAYAARDGQYRGLSDCSLEDDTFHFWLEIPLALGTVGGLTALHPLAKKSLEILGNPDAGTLMRIVASVGLAQNFSAVKSLVTTGIQQGHMKMHLQNILTSLHASEDEKKQAGTFFETHTVSYAAVRDFLDQLKAGSTIL